MKKIITKIISFAIIISLFTACGKEKVKNNETNEVKENKKVIYTSFYPLQSITKEIVGNKMEVRKLIPNGQEVHHWEPTAQDMKNLSEGSVILVNGLGLESWMDKFKESIKDLNVVEVSKDVNLLKAEEEHEENENHESEEKHYHGEYDPHIWLSLRNMKVIAKNICDKVVEMDKDNETYYRENLAKVQNRLDDLDKKYSEQLQNAKIKSIITSHEAFAYLLKDYGLKQIPIENLTSDSEPNLAKMKEVIELAKNEGIKYVFYEELSENKVEETIAKEIGGEVKMLYTIEGQTEEQAKENKDYFELMEENLKALVEATK
ncbi:zinc ABC transporter substrate-binding protein [Parvimonas sp. D2]|uniref:metal ABC transporter substrate-binding protein n=1 Tax=unclassified Parvimonas TaxID=1151464 RepID=UPI002B484A76|nr:MULTISPECIES: zinc ABC transporter substrate-binding protein [unclassified Parvimonas]MEB3012316.1 zinc ABC transporter substrate-binding protein [Parvimonas sp. D2]MEB3087739.1 zinc ABC transporter substrate-binding protein [Parvimonas sp. D4]